MQRPSDALAPRCRVTELARFHHLRGELMELPSWKRAGAFRMWTFGAPRPAWCDFLASHVC